MPVEESGNMVSYFSLLAYNAWLKLLFEKFCVSRYSIHKASLLLFSRLVFETTVLTVVQAVPRQPKHLLFQKRLGISHEALRHCS